MRPLTDHTPKPMLRLQGKPMLEYVIAILRKGGIRDIIITTHYLPEVIKNYFGNGSNLDINIGYSYESQRLNTAGSLRFIQGDLNTEFLVCGGHFILPTLNVRKLIQFHQQKGGKGTIAFKSFSNQEFLPFFGQGVLDKNGKLVIFEEKPEMTISNLVHTTYQVYSKEIVDLIPKGALVSIPRFLIPTLLEKSIPIFGYITKSDLINVSTFELYERAQQLAAIGLLGEIFDET